MGVYRPEPKNYESVASNSTSLVDNIMENTKEEDNINCCLQCGATMKDTDKFCPQCGYKRKMSGEKTQISEEKTGGHILTAIIIIVILIAASPLIAITACTYSEVKTYDDYYSGKSEKKPFIERFFDECRPESTAGCD